MSSNLGTQFRLTQTRNTGFLPSLGPRADRTRADDSEQISPPPIAHHTVYEIHRTFSETHVSQWGAHSYLVGLLSHLVGRPHFEPALSKGVLPLIIVAPNGSNGAISLTKTFSRILLYVCNRLYFGVQEARNGDREIILNTATLSGVSIGSTALSSLLAIRTILRAQIRAMNPC